MSIRSAKELAKKLTDARLNCTKIPLTEAERSAPVAFGYEVQQYMTEFMMAYGHEIAGYKIGATNQATRDRLGMTEPFFAPVYDPYVRVHVAPSLSSNAKSLERQGWGGLEAEFAYIISRDIPVRAAKYTRSEILNHILVTCPCIEFTQSRFTGVKSTCGLIVADGGNNGSLIVSSRETWRRPTESECLEANDIAVETYIEEKLVATGGGSEVEGHPLESLLWFANVQNRPSIQKGQLISSGAANGNAGNFENRKIRASWKGWADSKLDLGADNMCLNFKTYVDRWGNASGNHHSEKNH